jgi:hypothetical protein
MFSLEELANRVSGCRNGRISLDDFEDWFRDNSRGAYRDVSLGPAYFAVEAALSKVDFQRISEGQALEELEEAIRPFVLGPVYAPAHEIVYGKPPQQARSANPFFRWVLKVS